MLGALMLFGGHRLFWLIRSNMPSLSLQTSLSQLAAITAQQAQLLRRLGVETLAELLWYLPRDVLDFSQIRQPVDLQADQPQSVRGTVVDLDARQLRTGRTLSKVLLDCGTDFVLGNWFQQPWILRRFSIGQQVLFSGKPKRRQDRWEFSHPQVQWLDPEDDPDSSRLVLTRYRLTEGLKMNELRRLIAAALDTAGPLIEETLPEEMLRSLKLERLPAALRQVHRPASVEEFEAARARLIFDDFLEFQLGVALRRRAWRARSHAPILERTAKIDARIRRLFPFAYTEGQNKAVSDITGDLRSGIAMHRLLQADVGAGKTVVAIDSMLVAVAHGWQTVLMAPTELLASQHWQTIERALQGSRVQRVLLTGSLTAKERERALAGIADGTCQLTVGTQALIQAGVQFKNLGLAVIDEQHKFGVAQRAHFSAMQTGPPPHVLVMTATPIPRTLCLTQFGDLDVTLVSDLPAGRQPVVTSKVTGGAARTKAWSFLKEKLNSGRQLYVVCPLIEGDENSTAGEAAETVFRDLSSGQLAQYRVGLVHGRLKPDEREQVMEAFRERDLDVLVSTTVIEVGVDVPNATLMVIYNADRFGLSQLHQLRGRIARGKFRGYCFLFSESATPDGLTRLAVLERSGNGFEVAEQDFELRGPGDILGTRQHGELPLRFPCNPKEEKLLELARHEAQRLVFSGEFNRSEFATIRALVLNRFSRLLDLPRSG